MTETLPFHRRFLFLSTIAAACMLAACSASEPAQPVQPGEPPALPITEVVQTLDQGFERTWSDVLTVLNQRDIGTELVYKELGRITTDWVPMEDRMCDIHLSENAPLNCRTQYSLHVQPLAADASSVTIRYVEKCLGREQMELICPGSNAERRMIAVISDLKALTGIKK